MMKFNGQATSEGTLRYRQRVASHCDVSHFRQQQGIWFSSIGLGTYRGKPDESTNQRYIDAIQRAVNLSCNVIDTSINYRYQLSEKSVGAAIKLLFEQKLAQRDELIISTKGGFIPTNPQDQYFYAYFKEHYVDPGWMTMDDLLMGCHCLHPKFIEDQIEISRNNLGLETIDVYFIHNPEMQLEILESEQLYQKMPPLFEMLETKVLQGIIQWYGTSTWDGYRIFPDEPGALSLTRLLDIAKSVGGKDHHFRAIQFPFNMSMAEAWMEPTQTDGDMVSPLLPLALREGLICYASSSLSRGDLATGIPSHLAPLISELKTPAQKAIQFARSVPGVTTALVGMSRLSHVDENLFTATQPVMNPADYAALLSED